MLSLFFLSGMNIVGDFITEPVIAVLESIVYYFKLSLLIMDLWILFLEHLKQNLISHQQFLKDLSEDYKQRCTAISQRTSEASDRSASEASKQALENLHAQFLNCGKLVAQQYDLWVWCDCSCIQFYLLKVLFVACIGATCISLFRYLEENLPRFEILPVKISVNLASLKIQLNDIGIKLHQKYKHSTISMPILNQCCFVLAA
jgi:hypothetical protein